MQIKHKVSGLEFPTYGPVLSEGNPNNVGFIIYIPKEYYFDENGYLQPNPNLENNPFSGIVKPTGWIVVRATDFIPVQNKPTTTTTEE